MTITEAAEIMYRALHVNVVPFPIDEIRRANRERSVEIAMMSDAELDLEALRRACAEVFEEANQAAIDMSLAQQRMDRHLARHKVLKDQIEVAELLLQVART